MIEMGGFYYVEPKYDTKGMISPVLCRRCGTVYDLCNAEVKARYADATVFTTPCCNVQVDDRTWTSNPAIERL